MTAENSKTSIPNSEIQAFGKLLRFWRTVYKISQEELAHRIGSSARHISRMENGRVQPSQEMVLKLSESMKLSERDKNHFLVAAGFSPKVLQSDFFSEELRWLRNAMTLNLRALDPYPSSLSAADGELLMVNKGWVSFYQKLVGAAALQKVKNNFEFQFSLKSGVSHFDSWKNAWAMTLMSLHQDVLLNDDAALEALLARLMKQPDIPEDWAIRAAKFDPMTSFKIPLVVESQVQNFYNVAQAVSPLGPAAFVSGKKLIINTLYPESKTFNIHDFFNEDASHDLLSY